jgi:adenylate cyclase
MANRLLGDKASELPERVRTAIQSQGDATERLIGWIQLAVVLVFATLYAISPKTFPAEQAFQPVPWVIGAYALFTLLRVALAHRISLPGWFLILSIVFDMALLFGLIWSFHIQYQQPASFYLKAPTLLYVFIFIALRALRFEARFVIAAGLAAAVGWSLLVLYVITVDPSDNMITRDYVAYMTSNSILLGAEFDKMVSILMVAAILAVALIRGRALLIRAVTEGAAARELSRFFAPEVAERIRGAAQEVAVGSGELREAAILNLDLRGFTRFAKTRNPDEVMGVLAEYQHRMVQVIQDHGGSIDKFLGDGIMATFGVTERSESHAADALRALEQALARGAEWTADQRAEAQLSGGQLSGAMPCPEVNGAVATGRVMFGAVGDATRLEYTVIGDAVNLSAKLEQHNKVLHSRGLIDAATFDLACAQGYAPPADLRRLEAVEVAGLDQALNLVVLLP